METPQITNIGYASNSMQLGAVCDLGHNQQWNRLTSFHPFQSNEMDKIFGQQQETSKPMATTSRRIVQVFIADPNDNVPLDKSVLFKGEQKLTDATDAELFFEVPISEILKAHNEQRVTWLDKDASKRSGKDVLLDPVKIRDLRMVVVDIAKF